MENALLMICGLSAISVTGLFLLQAAAARVLTLALPVRPGEEDADRQPPPAPPAAADPEPEQPPEEGPEQEQAPPLKIEPPETVEGARVLSPFDGIVDLIEVKVAVGDTVEEGQVVARVEAMNGIHEVKAPHSGEVKALHVQVGAEVDPDQPIMTIGNLLEPPIPGSG